MDGRDGRDLVWGLQRLPAPVTLTLALSHQGRGDFPEPVCPGHTPLASLAPPFAERKGLTAGEGVDRS